MAQQNSDVVAQVLRLEKSRKAAAGSIDYDAKEFESRNNTQWIDSSAVKKCHRCSVSFTLTTRKHHCRNCGNVFCSNCTTCKLVVNGILKRACTDCYTRVMNGVTAEPSNVKPPEHRASMSFISNSPSSETKDALPSLHDETKPRSNSLTSNNSDPDLHRATHLKWVEALLLVKRADPDSPATIEASSSAQSLSTRCLNDILSLSMPSSKENKDDTPAEYNFCFLIPNDSTESAPSTPLPNQEKDLTISNKEKDSKFYFCFVSYKQTVAINSMRESFANPSSSRSTSVQQRSLVLISKLPIPNLAYSVLSTIETTLYHVLHPEPGKKGKTGSTQDITKAFEVSLEQIQQNWAPLVLSRGDSEENNAAGGQGQGMSWFATLALPFFGDILQFTVSIPRCIGGVTITHETYSDVSFESMSLGAAVTFSNGSNLISQFGPYGLVSHLWALWELLIQGNDIIVVAPTPDAASQLVIALSSLVLTPVDSFKGCHIYPYVTRQTSNISSIVSAVKKRRQANSKETPESSGGSFIVGITDPTLLLDFRDFNIMIALSPKRDVVATQEFSPELLRKTEKRSSFSGKMTGANKNLTMEDMEQEALLRFNPKFLAPMRFPTESELSQEKVYSTSRISVEDVPITREDLEETPYGSETNRPVPTIATIVPPTATAVPSDTQASLKKELSKKRPESDKDKRAPSFFSRSFIAWKNLTNRGVYTPGLIVFPHQPVASPLQDAVCKRLKKLSVRDYLILGNRILRDHFDELTAAYFKPIIEEHIQEEEKEHKRKLEAKLAEDLANEESKLSEVEEFEEITELIKPKNKLPPALERLLSTFIKSVEVKHQFVVTSVTSALAISILFEFKLIALALCLVLVVAQVPDNDLMKSLKTYIPHEKKTQRKKIVALAPVARSSTSTTTIVPRANFSGVWKRGKLVNFEEFAGAQGASFVQRKLASSITMTHTITMDPELTVVRIQEKGGPLNTDALLVIGGDGAEVSVGPKTYLDTVIWETPDVLRLTRLFLPDKDHELLMIRRLENNGQTIRQDQTYHHFASGVRVDATSYFDYQGPSPNPLPATVRLKAVEDTPKESSEKPAEVDSNKRDLTGVWVRTRTHNVDSYVGAQGAGFVQRKLAVSVAMTHIITMNPPDLNAFRLQEKGGPLDSDIFYSVDTMPMATQIMKRNFMDTVTWIADSTPPTLLVTRVHEDNDFSLIHKRYIDEDDASGEPTLVLVAKHVDHATGTETVGTSWFKYSGPSPNPPPQPSGVPITPQTTTPAQVEPMTTPPVVSQPVIATVVESPVIAIPASVLNEEPTPSPPTTTSSTRQLEPRKFESSGMPKRVLSMSLRVDLSGVWQRVDAAGSKGIFGSFSSTQMVHTITMDPPFYSGVRIQEIGGPINSDYTFELGGEYTPTIINGKKFLERCYWEGEALVQKRVPETRDYELVMKRYLETPNMGLGSRTAVGKKDSKLRIVTVKINLATGNETETIQFFKKTGPSPLPLGDVHGFKRPPPAPAGASNMVFFTGNETPRVAFAPLNEVDEQTES